MSRYIDAEELNKLLSEAKNGIPVFNGGICKAQMIVREMPTADVEEVRHGEWLPTGICYACSECDFYVYNTAFEEPAFYHQGYHYCPNCGAKMDKEKEK